MKTVIDRDKCQGHGRCALTVFDVDDYGTGLVLVDQVSEQAEAEVREAVPCCPENATTVAD